jgi:dienelactone hydrolase
MRAMYEVRTGGSNISPGDADYLFLPRKIRGSSKYGVLLLHGAGAPDQFIHPARPGSAEIPMRLAAVGIPCLAGTMSGDGFANPETVGDVGTAITYLSSAAGVPSTKVHIVGISMGGALGMKYAQTNPSKVASFTGIIPLCDINDIYVNNKGGLQAAIGTAWGVTYPTALPAGANLYTNAASMASVPSRLYYSDADALITPSSVTTMGTAMGAQLVQEYDMGNVPGGISGLRWSALIEFLIANGA